MTVIKTMVMRAFAFNSISHQFLRRSLSGISKFSQLALCGGAVGRLAEQRTPGPPRHGVNSPEIAMFRNIQTVVAIQEHVLRWRRLAAEVTDPQTARRLRDLADEMEVRARELDRTSITQEI
jgi:hypothetical protein